MTALWPAPAAPQALATTCKHCGSGSGFRQRGRVTTRATRTSRTITTSGGSVTVAWNSLDVDRWPDEREFEPDTVECRGCGADATTVLDLLGAPPAYEPGDRVFCPDGLTGVVATVDPDARTLTIDGWHETFTYADIAPAWPL